MEVTSYLVRLADDQVILANTEKRLQKIMDRLNDTAKAYETKSNVAKRKVMKLSRNEDVIYRIIDEQKLEKVSSST